MNNHFLTDHSLPGSMVDTRNIMVKKTQLLLHIMQLSVGQKREVVGQTDTHR